MFRKGGRRARVLEAYVEITLAAKDIPAARAAADELTEIAARREVPYLSALSARANGAVLLAEGDARAAMTELRRSCGIWCDLHAPFEAARTQVLIAMTGRALGVEQEALQELAAARDTFAKLGAAVDLACVEALLSKSGRDTGGPLTDREMEVLKLVASGMTNRQIASQLKISEKTVARHLSNIFTKLDLSSRSAATAYAYSHGLV